MHSNIKKEIVLNRGNTEKQHLPRIRSLFDPDADLFYFQNIYFHWQILHSAVQLWIYLRVRKNAMIIS